MPEPTAQDLADASSRPAVAAEARHYKILGTRPPRPDGIDKVIGRAQYSNDFNVPGHLHARLLRSPHAHARILSIDASRALALPGVRAVITGADFPRTSGAPDTMGEGAPMDVAILSELHMAREEALYAGHAVAAVAADSLHLAEDALALVDVQYEVLPHIVDVSESMKLGAYPVRAGLPEGPVGTDGVRYSQNVAKIVPFELGDVANGFEMADVILERDFVISPSHTGYIEPQTATAFWSHDNQITIWGSSQGHFTVRDYTAGILGVPVANVKVIPLELGGGFGAKTMSSVEPIAALLSHKTGKPVKLGIGRKEVFDSIGPTSGGKVHLKMGFRDDGTITAADARLVMHAGCFGGSVIGAAIMCMFTPYDIPNARAIGFDVLTNTPKTTPYRGPGAPIGAFVVEGLIDEFAQLKGMDPIDLRLMNTANENSKQIIGMPSPPVPFRLLLETAKNHPHYTAPLGGPNRGRGVAGGYWFNAGGPASAVATVMPDGGISLIEGNPDPHGIRGSAAMQFAETLGLPLETIRPIVGDTDSVGYTSLTGGSSTAFKTGWACYEAALDVKRQMIDRAALIWGVDASAVKYEDQAFTSTDGKSMTWKQLAAKMKETGGTIVGRASLYPRGIAPTYALHIADVEVDTETGKTTLLRYTTFQDAGTVVHPSYVEGQMQGGAAQGIGWALNEEYVFDAGGTMSNSSFLDYRMPTALDLPFIDTVITETPNPGHPFGVRGVAEVPIVPPLGTIGNAVSHATGVRQTRVPMSPRNVLESLEAAGQR